MPETNEKQANTWAMLCHLTALSCFIGIPFGHIVAPLIIWLTKKDEFPQVNEHGKESLNFQISMTIYGLVVGLLCFIVIGLLLIPVLLIADLVLVIMATVKASNGESFQYPYTIRFIK